MGYQTIIVGRKEHIGVITLNQPEKLNVFSAELGREFNDALLELDGDNSIFVVVIKAAGRSFCAGVELSLFVNKTALERRDILQIFNESFTTLHNMSKPIIAAVQGYALAAGTGIVAACDLAVATDDAHFGSRTPDFGLFCFVPSADLSRCLGRKKCLELLLTGDLIDAREAERIGLVNKVVPPEELDEEATKLAKKLADKAPLALRLGRRAFHVASDMEYGAALQYLKEMMAILATTEDAMEGVTAFLEKRKPQWKGR